MSAAASFSSKYGRPASARRRPIRSTATAPPLFRIIEVKEPPPKDLNDYLDKRVAIASFEKNIEGDWWIELDHWQ